MSDLYWVKEWAKEAAEVAGVLIDEIDGSVAEKYLEQFASRLATEHSKTVLAKRDDGTMCAKKGHEKHTPHKEADLYDMG